MSADHPSAEEDLGCGVDVASPSIVLSLTKLSRPVADTQELLVGYYLSLSFPPLYFSPFPLFPPFTFSILSPFIISFPFVLLPF